MVVQVKHITLLLSRLKFCTAEGHVPGEQLVLRAAGVMNRVLTQDDVVQQLSVPVDDINVAAALVVVQS